MQGRGYKQRRNCGRRRHYGSGCRVYPAEGGSRIVGSARKPTFVRDAHSEGSGLFLCLRRPEFEAIWAVTSEAGPVCRWPFAECHDGASCDLMILPLRWSEQVGRGVPVHERDPQVPGPGTWTRALRGLGRSQCREGCRLSRFVREQAAQIPGRGTSLAR